MWTLAEAQKMSNDVLIKGIIETIIKESPLLAKLPFLEVNGTGLTYNRETTQPTAGFYAVNDTWAESTGTRTQDTASLTILGGDSDLDNFQAQTLSDSNDLEAQLIEEKSKAIAHKFDDTAIYGDATVDTKQFSGLHAKVDSTMLLHQGSGSTGAPLSMANLDKLCDLVMPGRPDALIMNRTVRRRLQQYYREGTGISFVMKRGEDGAIMATYGDIPILVNDFLVQTETIATASYSAKTGGYTSSIFAIKFGPRDLAGIQNGGIQKQRLGNLETKDAIRWRIKWYVGLVMFSTLSVARLDGITDAVATD